MKNRVTFRRQYGLFSNVNVLQRFLSEVHIASGELDEVNLILTEYFQKDTNIFNELFEISKTETLTLDDCQYLLNNCPADKHGLFNNVVYLPTINKVKAKYLNHSKQVMDFEKRLIIDNKIPHDFMFIWFRGTDKITESSRPSYLEFIAKMQQLNVSCLPIVVSTDDYWFLKALEHNNIKHINIHLTKLSLEGKPIHQDILNKVSEEDFFKENGISKTEYLQGLLATTHIASHAKIYLATCTSINSYVIQQRGNFNDVYVYENNKDFLF